MNYVQTTMYLLGKPEPLRQSSLLVVLAGSLGHGEAFFRGLETYALEQTGVWSTRVSQLRGLLEMGYSLSEALAIVRDLLPPETISAIRIAEQAGTLPGILIAEAQRLTQDRTASLLSSPLAVLGYLSSLVCVLTIVISFLMVKVMPKLKEIFLGFGIELPAPTLLMMNTADMLITAWPAILPPIVASLVGSVLVVIVCRYQSLRYGSNFISNRWPRSWTPCILRQLSFAACAEQPLVNSLDSLMMEAPPCRATRQMSSLRHRVHSGEGLVDALTAAGFLKRREAMFLTAASAARHLDWALMHTANAIELRRDLWLQGIASLAVPVLMLTAGGLVIFVVIGLFAPVIKLINDLSCCWLLSAGGML